MNNIKIGKSSKFVAEYDKKSQSSQKVQNLFFYKKKLDEFFQNKHEFFKFAKDSKIVVKCDWNITISQNVQFFSQNWWIFWKKLNNIEIGKSCKFVAEYDKNSQSSQNVQNLLFIKKNRWVFPEQTWVLQNC